MFTIRSSAAVSGLNFSRRYDITVGLYEPHTLRPVCTTASAIGAGYSFRHGLTRVFSAIQPAMQCDNRAESECGSGHAGRGAFKGESPSFLTALSWGIFKVRNSSRSGRNSGYLTLRWWVSTWEGISQEKAVDRLLGVFAALRGRDPPTFICCSWGGGPSLDDCRQLARDTGMAERVTFTGPISYERIGGVLGVADFFVSASVSEGTSSDLHRGRGRGSAIHWDKLSWSGGHDYRRKDRLL